MTQPNTVDMTFDTSLVDLNTSFSTTESDPSEIDLQTTQKTPILQQGPLDSQETPKQSQTTSSLNLDAHSPPPKPSTPVQHIPTQDAYDQWADVYDTDGNMLQAIDDLELSTLLPDFLSKVLSSTPPGHAEVMDLGCGTGRNTAKLLSYPWPEGYGVTIIGLDFSKGMLNVAQKKLHEVFKNAKQVGLHLAQTDCFPTVTDPNASPRPAVQFLPDMDALISTLVLEHIPLQPYFATLATLLKSGGHALVTNMHSEMGKISQAGFINAQGVKVRGHSYAHTPQETIEEAQRAGFEVVSIKERKMEKEDVDSGRVGERGGKWIGVHVWYGLVLRKVV